MEDRWEALQTAERLAVIIKVVRKKTNSWIWIPLENVFVDQFGLPILARCRVT